MKTLQSIVEGWHEDVELWKFFEYLWTQSRGEKRKSCVTNFTEIAANNNLTVGLVKNWLSQLQREGVIAVRRITKSKMVVTLLRRRVEATR
jgi:hypothetical protein